MADDLSLLFRLRAENTQAKAVLSDTRAAVAQLRQSFGPQLTQTVTVASKSFSDLGDNLSNFVAQRVPLVGGAIVRVTDALRGASREAPKTEKAIASVAKSIQSIATESGKSVPQIASFLTRFIQIEGQAKRDQAAVDFFGASLSAKLIPQLEQTGTALAGVAGEGATAGSSIAAMAGPIGIAVLALAALAAGAVVAAKELFALSKRTAEFQGKMFDLAQQTGLAVETLSALEVEAKKTGGSIDTIAQSMFNFQRKLDDAQDPLSKTAERFRRFGIDTSDTETALRSAFAALARMPEGFAQTNAAAELFGARGGKQVLAILKETNGDIDGTIKRLREAGALITDETARAADRFNDELALLDFQVRAASAALVEELIPAITEMIRTTSELVTASRPLISLFATIAGTAIRPVVQAYKGLSLVVLALTGDYKGLEKAIREANEAQNIAPLKVPGVTPVPLPGAPSPVQGANDAVNQAEAVSAAVKRAVADNAQALDQLFQTGRINRQQQTEAAIADIQKEAKAESDRIDALIKKREEEFKVARDLYGRESEAAQNAAADINKLQVQQLEAQANAQRKALDLRFRALQEAAETERQTAQETANTVIKELDRGIAAVQDRISREDIARKESLTLLDQFEQAKIEIQILALEQQKQIGRLTLEEQRKINAQILTLNQDLDLLRDAQDRRRQERERQVSQRTVSLIESTLDTQLNILRTRGQALIATENALADLRVKSHEAAAKKILQINLDLIDAEIETLKARFTAAETLPDENESLRLRVELNNQIKVLMAERSAIEAQGNRAIDDARQQDILNERRYAAELEDIKDRIRDIERDTAQEKIRLMILNFASRKDIITAQRKLDLAEEEDRHRRVTESIDTQKREIDEQVTVLEKFIERLKPKTQEEIDERQRLIDKLEELRAKRAELGQQEDAENERSETRKRSITVEAEIEIANPDESLRDVFDGIGESLTNLAGKLAEVIGAGQEFAAMSGQIAAQIGGALAGAFDQFANALGQTVANWVLLGETGPAVMRKILAQALASLAAEAAVQAIKQLALGFATLFFNPAESAAHFTAAALWGSIAGVSAIAGRGIAGDLFKSKSASGGGAGASSQGSQQISPITLGRNQPQTQVVRVENVIRVQSNDAHIVKVVANDYRHGGDVRQVIIEDGGPSA